MITQALFDHADRTPEDPWLFRRMGWDWRWISFRAAAAEVRARMADSGSDVILRRGTSGRIWEEERSARPDPSARNSPQDDFASSVLSDLALQAVGQPVTVQNPDGESVTLSSDDLAQAAAAISRALPEMPAKRREILVLGGALDEPATRAMLSWATVAGAALLLEHDAGSVLGSAVWARPTLFAGTVEQIAGLRRAAERQEEGIFRRLRRPGRPFGRLHTVFATDLALPATEESFWRDRGVCVRFLPQCGIAWYIGSRGDRHA
jgi:hypothetical protein